MNQNHFAVVVGINPYPEISYLTAAHSDASDFYDWVISPNGGQVPTTNAVLILGDDSGPEASPTRESVNDAVEDYKARVESVLNLDPTFWLQTRLYFFCAGHGIASERNDSALLAANAKRTRYTRHISCTSLLEFFTRVQSFSELVIFADCCRTSTIDTVPRMPADFSGDDKDRGGVRKFMACGAIFGRKAKEETNIPADQRRGYFTRALMDGLRTGPQNGKPVTSSWLKDHISGHMRRASETLFDPPLDPPLKPDFVDEGANPITFGFASESPSEYPVKIFVRSMPIAVVEIRAEGLNTITTVRNNINPALFECLLPIGLFEAFPIGVAPPAPGKEWLFKVPEGGATYAF